MELRNKIDIFYFLFVATMVFCLLGGGVVYLFLLYQKRLYRQQVKLQEVEIANRVELLNNTIRQVDEERRRIAKDLHDEIGSLFSVLSIKLGQLEPLLSFSRPGAKIIEDGRNLIDTGIKSVQRISYDIVPPLLAAHGLAVALEDLCSRVGSSVISDIAFRSVEYLPELPDLVSLSLYRIVQELLSNAIRHAGATRIELRLEQLEDRLFLYYLDNGKGFDYQETNSRKGAGLRNIEARVRIINGKILFEGGPGKGTQIVVITPINSSLHANG